jgi:type IV secretory pathway VirB2 component (pilin)
MDLVHATPTSIARISMDRVIREIMNVLTGPFGLVFIVIFVVVMIMIVRGGPKKY